MNGFSLIPKLCLLAAIEIAMMPGAGAMPQAASVLPAATRAQIVAPAAVAVLPAEPEMTDLAKDGTAYAVLFLVMTVAYQQMRRRRHVRATLS